MDKMELHMPSLQYRKVKYGKRYGYWWKKHREVARQIKDYSPAIDYFSNLEYELDKPMSYKHFDRWTKGRLI